jgi:hypothetical protein
MTWQQTPYRPYSSSTQAGAPRRASLGGRIVSNSGLLAASEQTTGHWDLPIVPRNRIPRSPSIED